MIGQILGHYQITGLLGKGGMGEVYRARDTRLDRDVALKVLPADVASDPARLERFQREAKTVAGLNHSHIVTLYSVEEDAGVHFLTMEVVEGQGLDHVLTADGLPLTKVFDIGIAVADALAAAHEKGIVHRDLKPANVMIAKDGRVKVLDFGLAKLNDATSSPDVADTVSPLTTEGAVMGTVPYMSPEQLRGQNVDHRSDIFSFGILLYEMASGRRPFTGPTNADISASVLTTTPEPITRLKPDLPEHLGRIVAQCLEKDPEERYQSAKDIRNELRGLRREIDSGASVITGTRSAISSAPSGAVPVAGRSRKGFWIGLTVALLFATGAMFYVRYNGGSHVVAEATDVEKTIAVLPFVNMSGDPNQEFFSDGISEELLNLMSKVPKLRVAARTSSFSFKGKSVEIPEIAKQLNVAYVLEGSVRKSGEQVRITAQLIHASDGFHVWSETYDRKLDNIFAIQDEIAADVVKQLQVTLLGTAPTARKTDPEAYALYLQAVYFGRLMTTESLTKSNALLDHVLEIDSTYAPAWVQRSSNTTNQVNSGLLTAREGFARARAEAARALEIDPDDAPTHALFAFVAMYGDNDLVTAAKHLERALALDPTNVRALGNSALLLMNLGRLNEGLAFEEAFARRDPVNVSTQTNLGAIQLAAGQNDAAIATFRFAMSLSPERDGAHYGLASAMLLNGDASAALAEVNQERAELWRLVGLSVVYHALGRKAESDKALADLVAKYQADRAYDVASIHAFRGEADLAFEWLEKARANGDPLSEILGEPFFANIHNDPRWLPLLRSVGKAPEQLEKIHFKVTLPDA